MSVHYKFKSAIGYETITFGGRHISVADLKKAIVQQKKLGKATDFDLLITNAQTNEGKRTKLFLVFMLIPVRLHVFLFSVQCTLMNHP